MSTTVIVVSPIYPPESGGPAIFARNYSRFLAKKFLNVKVITHGDQRKDILDDGVSVIFVPKKQSSLIRTLRMTWAIYRTGTNDSNVLSNGSFIETAIACLFRRTNFTAKIPGDVTWEWAVNNSHTNLSLWEFQTTSQIPPITKFYRLINRWAIKQATAVIVPTQELCDLVISWGVERSRIEIIPNSVDTEKFAPIEGSQKIYDLLTVCRLVPWKGLSELISLASEFDLSLAIVGDGPERSQLEEFSKVKNARVTFFGNINQFDLPDIYNSAKFFVLNSSYEATSYSLLEAKSCGLVSIANGDTGSAEVIHPNIDGFLFTKSSGSSILTCLKLALGLDDGFDKMAQMARKDAVERFDLRKNFERIYLISCEVNE